MFSPPAAPASAFRSSNVLAGFSAIISLREKFGVHLPAILATADRGHDRKDSAAKFDIRVLDKLLKPAALRALLTQWRILEGALI